MLQLQVINDMKACPQTSTQSVYQHGESVRDRMFQLINILKTGEVVGNWRLPEWIQTYKIHLIGRLCSEEIIEEYTTFHDCGKPYCLTYDDAGKKHFPNHAETSYSTWLLAGGSPQAAKLMRMDMMIHQIKATDIDEFIKHPEAITLLLTGLSEIHSNAEMFGGLDSEGFKIKWNQINKRGKAICKKLFEEI